MSSDSTVLIGGQLKRWRLVMVVIAVLGYGLDQWAKVEAVAHLDPYNPPSWFGGLITLRLLRNPGAAFSMGSTVTVLISLFAVAMLVAGMLIASLPLKEIVLSKRIYLVAFLRLMLIPLILLMFVKVSGIAHLGGHSDTVVLISFLATVSPAASTVTQMAMVYGQNARKASAIYGITTLLCVITMPLMIALYQAMV